MTGPGDRIRPADLESVGERLDHEVATAYAVARQLENELLDTEASMPTPGFADRVMIAVAREPRPRPAAFLAPLERRRSLAGLRESLGLAWRVVLGATLPTRARASALAYVLAVLLVAGSATTFVAYGAAGALGWLGTTPTLSPSPTNANPSAAPTDPLGEPGESTGPEASGQPEDSSDAGDGPSAGPDALPGVDPTRTPSATDDNGPSPTSGDEHGGNTSPSPSADATQTPRPSGTPKASQTPEPSKTPSPTSSSHG